ncbi:unnamed protein product [Ambrosiozyma monospora]|uniref:Unnamed protein product n=1 Tax=Ambrosiozyma monospora TaxID=43982 RepID=A0ACB5T408_AMBMO|nr:unnamed protein product [Ambrosiozyma monospora]
MVSLRKLVPMWVGFRPAFFDSLLDTLGELTIGFPLSPNIESSSLPTHLKVLNLTATEIPEIINIKDLDSVSEVKLRVSDIKASKSQDFLFQRLQEFISTLPSTVKIFKFEDLNKLLGGTLPEDTSFPNSLELKRLQRLGTIAPCMFGIPAIASLRLLRLINGL